MRDRREARLATVATATKVFGQVLQTSGEAVIEAGEVARLLDRRC